MSETKFTPGPWHAPHFAMDDHTCNCRSVVSEFYAGAVCVVETDNGKRISEGGNDAPVLSEAKANAHLIAAAPEMFDSERKLANEVGGLRAFEDEIRAVIGNTNWSVLMQRADEALAVLAKARGEAS